MSRFMIISLACALLFSCKTPGGRIADIATPSANLTYTEFSNLYNDGIDLYIYSAEAGWQISVDFENRLIYKTADGAQTAFTGEKLLSWSADITQAISFTDGTNTLSIKLIENSCIDATNGYTNPWSAEVTFNDVLYRGCALYTFDKRINGYWRFEKVNGVTTSLTGSSSNTLLIDADMHYVSAVFDCDSMSAAFTAENLKTKIGSPALFPLKCRNYRTQKTLIQIIQDAENYQLIGDSILILKSPVNEFLFSRTAN